MPSGNYRYEVSAVDLDGNELRVDTEITGQIDSVTFENGYPELIIGGARVQPADILEVIFTNTSESQNADLTDVEDESEDSALEVNESESVAEENLHNETDS